MTKVRVKKLEVYEIETLAGESLGRFVLHDAWNGFQELTRLEGSGKMILGPGPLKSFFDNPNDPEELPILVGSPDIVAKVEPGSKDGD